MYVVTKESRAGTCVATENPPTSTPAYKDTKIKKMLQALFLYRLNTDTSAHKKSPIQTGLTAR